METPSGMNFNEPAASAPSKLGVIGIAVGVLGLIVYCLPLVFAFLMGATGNSADANGTTLVVIAMISNCGSVIGIVGAILGGVSLARGENKTYGIIAIVMGVLLMFTCIGLNVIGAFVTG